MKLRPAELDLTATNEFLEGTQPNLYGNIADPNNRLLLRIRHLKFKCFKPPFQVITQFPVFISKELNQTINL